MKKRKITTSVNISNIKTVSAHKCSSCGRIKILLSSNGILCEDCLRIKNSD